MNESTNSAIHYVFATILFTGLLSYYLFQYGLLNTFTNQVGDHFQEQDRDVVQHYQIPKETYITGYDVLYSLYHLVSSSTYLEVDGYVFHPNEGLDQQNVTMINLQKKYEVSYQRSSSGDLTKIIVTSIQ